MSKPLIYIDRHDPGYHRPAVTRTIPTTTGAQERELSWFARIEPTPPAVAATPSVFVATMDTTNFSFVAVGADEASAVAAMVGVMRAHRAQYGSDTWHPGYYAGTFDQFGDEYPTDGAAESEWLTWIAIEWYGVAVVELEMGHGARDGEAT